MNKTININLANTFFHIDEDAYNKLQRYLAAIKRSFTDSQGRDEIIADIEARIAELFTERMQHDRQVISTKEVDEVIQVMGQPEDYLVDEEIFEDSPRSSSYKQKPSKKLYRDIDNKYLGGVSSGLGHYLGIDAVWLRLLWVILTLFSGGGFALIYIVFWIIVPEAATTSQKIDMTGKPVNISNIEKKVKEGFDEVADTVKNVDYEKVGNKVKSSSRTFFDTLGDIILFFFKVFAKFVGIIFIITGASAIIALFVSLFTVGIVDVIHFPGVDFVDLVNTTGTPLWVASLLCFFAVGIPFFFLFLLGLKILVTNLKSIGNIAKYSLLAIWLLSIVGLIVLGAKQAAEHAYTGSVSNKEVLAINSQDTLLIKMNNKDFDNFRFDRDFGLNVFYDENDEERLYSRDVRFYIRHSEDSLAYVNVRKDANGRNPKVAKERAQEVDYEYTLENNLLSLDRFLSTSASNKFRDQGIAATVYIPTGTIVRFDESTTYRIGGFSNNDRGYYRSEMVKYTWKMGADGELKCLDCPEETENEIEEDELDSGNITLDKNGLDINLKDEDGDEFKMKVDEDGVKIKTNNNLK